VGHIQGFWTIMGNHPSDVSPAATEIAASPNPPFVETICTQATLMLESAIDYLHAFAFLADSETRLAPFAVMRGAIEASALAAWLAEKIPAEDRLSRSFGFRFANIREEGKYVAAAGITKDYKPTIENLADKATKSGIAVIRNDAGEVKGIGTTLPGFTGLAEKIGIDDYYRLLSGLAHSFTWASTQLAYSKIAGNPIGVANAERFGQWEKKVNPGAFVLSAIVGLDAFAIASSRVCAYFGKPQDQHEELVRGMYAGLGVPLKQTVEAEFEQ
jgi:hypothetical protein